MTTWEVELFKTQREALITEREGMIAENMDRARKGLAVAYTEEAFQQLVGEFAGLEERIRNAG